MKVEDVKGIYNSTAKAYEEFVIPCKLCQYLMLMHELNMRGNERVLELGSGPGYLSMEIAKRVRGGHVTGVDISEEMVKIANKRALKNLKFIVGDVTNLPFADNVFDISVNSYLIHWLPDAPKVLNEVHRVLKDGGRLGIILPSQEWYKEIQQAYIKVMEKFKEHVGNRVLPELVGIKMYSEMEIEGLLRQAGFDVGKLIAFKFKETTPIDMCLKRVDAKSGENYLSLLPMDIRKIAKQELVEELKSIEMSTKLITAESGYIIIANKR